MVNNDQSTKTFVAKVTKTRNRKDKDYFIYRLNVPNQVAAELEIADDDYLVMKAKKAEWYHLMDWTESRTTWIKLPSDIKAKIIADGLLDTENSRIKLPTILFPQAEFRRNVTEPIQEFNSLESRTSAAATLATKLKVVRDQSLGQSAGTAATEIVAMNISAGGA